MKIKEIRTSRGLSQSKLAELSGVNLRTLQQYEAGSRDINGVKLSSLLDLCLALDCDLTDILTDQELITKLERFRS